MIYLVSPYSSPDPTVREQRFHAACGATAQLLRLGHITFSPVVHGHPLAIFGLPTDWSYWKPFARAMIRLSDEVVVLTLDGWRKSVGVAAEIEIAGEFGTPVRYLAPVSAELSPTLAQVAAGSQS